MSVRTDMLGHVWARAGLAIALVIVANHAASALFARFDLTGDRRYTLSDASIASVDHLDRPLVATIYVTGDLAAPYHHHQQAIAELMDELRAHAHGQLDVRIVDPVGADADTAKARGVLPVEYRFADTERRERRQVYLGVVLSYGDREEAIAPIDTLDTLEYDVVRSIRRLTAGKDDRRTVGWVQGNGAPDALRAKDGSPLAGLRDQLAAEYDVVGVRLGGDQGVPDAVNALIVVGGAVAWPPRAVYQLDQFIARGGAVDLFVTTARPDVDQMRVIAASSGLLPLIGSLGVRVDPGLVLDRAHADVLPLPVAAGSRTQRVPFQHPLMPITSDLAPDSPIHRGLQRVTAPFAAPLAIAEVPAGVDARVLIQSMPSSTAAPIPPSLRPDAVGKPSPDERPGPFPLAVSLSGSFRSLFADQPIPPSPIDGGPPDDPTSKITDGADARVIVVGSSDFVANNPAWVVNSVDWLLADPALAGIRARGLGPPTFEPIATGDARRWKFGMTGLPLLGIALIGAWTSRRGRR